MTYRRMLYIFTILTGLWRLVLLGVAILQDFADMGLVIQKAISLIQD